MSSAKELKREYRRDVLLSAAAMLGNDATKIRIYAFFLKKIHRAEIDAAMKDIILKAAYLASGTEDARK